MISIAIPVYRPNLDHLRSAITTAKAAASTNAEILLVVDGSEGVPAIDGDTLESVRVITRHGRPGLAAAWNCCLEEAVHPYVHILHQDDLVDFGFYETIRLGFSARPAVLLVATGFRDIDPEAGIEAVGDASELEPTVLEPITLTGDDAARFLLVGGAHCCGSVALRREAVIAAGGFSDEYPYGPDEEAYLRFAAGAGIVYVPGNLYLQRSHAGQTRFRTWTEPDFIRTYFRSRIDGARHYGAEVQHFARRSATRGATSAMVATALRGHRSQAAAGMARLIFFERNLGDLRLWSVLLLLLTPGGVSVLRWRRERRGDARLTAAPRS
jgi:GT2 family glycosyltransferase